MSHVDYGRRKKNLGTIIRQTRSCGNLRLTERNGASAGRHSITGTADDRRNKEKKGHLDLIKTQKMKNRLV